MLRLLSTSQLKLKGMVLRLALTAEIVRWAADANALEPRTISAETLGACIQFVDSYAKPTALRVFGDAALPAVDRHAAMLARYTDSIWATGTAVLRWRC